LQVPKNHFPVVGLVALALVVVAGGSIFYYQFVLAPSVACRVAPVHRLIFMTAIIHERGGYNIFNAAILNQTRLPSFSNTTGPNMAGVKKANYKTSDNSTIQGSQGDTITLYIKAISTNETAQQATGATGHGFTIDTDVNSVNGTLPNNNLVFGTWYTVTFTVGTVNVSSTYHCTQFCSQEHPQMRGAFSVGCGA